MQDIAMIDDMLAPVRVLFWRTSQETMVKHRCPLIDPLLGIVPERVLCLDVLHTLHLGPCHTYVVYATWALLRARAFGDHDALTQDGLILACMALRQELHRWYRERHSACPSENLTRVHNVEPKVVGSSEKPKFKAKAAETYGLLLFVNYMLHRYHGVIPSGKQLHDGGLALENIVKTIKDSPPVVPTHTIQDC